MDFGKLSLLLKLKSSVGYGPYGTNVRNIYLTTKCPTLPKRELEVSTYLAS